VDIWPPDKNIQVSILKSIAYIVVAVLVAGCQHKGSCPEECKCTCPDENGPEAGDSTAKTKSIGIGTEEKAINDSADKHRNCEEILTNAHEQNPNIRQEEISLREVSSKRWRSTTLPTRYLVSASNTANHISTINREKSGVKFPFGFHPGTVLHDVSQQGFLCDETTVIWRCSKDIGELCTFGQTDFPLDSVETNFLEINGKRHLFALALTSEVVECEKALTLYSEFVSLTTSTYKTENGKIKKGKNYPFKSCDSEKEPNSTYYAIEEEEEWEVRVSAHEWGKGYRISIGYAYVPIGKLYHQREELKFK